MTEIKQFNNLFKETIKEWGKIQFRIITKDFKKIYIVEQELDNAGINFINSFIIRETITKDGKTEFLRNEIVGADKVANFVVEFLESFIETAKKYGKPETVSKLYFVTFRF